MLLSGERGAVATGVVVVTIVVKVEGTELLTVFALSLSPESKRKTVFWVNLNA